MSSTTHPRFTELLKWAVRMAGECVEFEAELFRVAGPRHTSAKEIVSGIGAFRAGGRWNPIGVMNVVYLSVEPETAMRESLEHFRYNRLPVSKAFPKVTVSVAVKVGKMLDLTNPDLASRLPISLSELMSEDWRALVSRGTQPGSQAVGVACFQAGIQAVQVPSKPDPNGANILVFPETLTGEDRLEVTNADQLDKLGKPT